MKADYIHKDSLTLGELDGVQVAVSPEAYEEIKKQKIIEENKILKELQQELERYKNIIDGLEKDLINSIEESDLKGCSFEQTYITGKWTAYKKTLNKLKKLKGSDCNE